MLQEAEYLQKQQELRAAYGQSTSQVDLQYAQKQLAIAALKKDKDESDAKEFEVNMKKRGELMTNMGDLTASFLEIAASNETEFSEFKKIATLVQITTDTASAIASMVTKGALSSATPIDAAIKITAGIAVVLANIAKAKQVLSQSDKVQAPQFQKMPGREHGGPTDILSLYMDTSGNPEGRITRPTLFNLGARSWMGGEKGKEEYVFSNAMLQNPVFAQFAAMTETLRTSGFDFSKNADMQPNQGGGGTAELQQMIAVMIAETRANTAAVQEFAKKPWNYDSFEKEKQLIDYARNDTKA